MTMKRIQPSLYQRMLKRTVVRRMETLSPNVISYHLQKFVFLLNEYFKFKFDPNVVPIELVAFRDEIEIFIAEPEKRFKFQRDDDEDLEIVISQLMEKHMLLCRKGSSEIQNLIKDFSILIPWKDRTPSHPSTSSGSLSPFTPSPSPPTLEGNGNCPGPSGLYENVQTDENTSSDQSSS